MTFDGALLLQQGRAARARTPFATCPAIAYAPVLQELAEPRHVPGLDDLHRPSRALFLAYEPPSDRFNDDCSLEEPCHECSPRRHQVLEYLPQYSGDLDVHEQVHHPHHVVPLGEAWSGRA